MFEQAWRLFRTDLALDIGSARTRIFLQDQGLAYDEPTLVVTEQQGRQEKIVTMGNQAKQYLGRCPPTMEIHHPVVQSICVKPAILERYIKQAIQQCNGGSSFIRPKILMVMPHGLTSQERKTYIDILYRLGNRESVFVDTLLCAGLGSQLPINEPIGSILVHIGHGSTQVGIMTLSGLAASQRTTVGGASINQAIVSHLQKERQLEIGLHLASAIKESIGNAEVHGESRSYPCTVKDTTTNQFRQVDITSQDIAQGLYPPLQQIASAIRKAVSTVSPELCADIIQQGIMLSGGGAQLSGVDDLLSSELRLPVFLSDQPHLSSIKGAGELLNNIDLLDWIGEENG